MTHPGDADNLGSTAAPATAEETRTYLIERSNRTFTPIPKVFVQNPDRKATPDRAGPLADFVRRGDKRGLLAFLFVHTIISSGDHEDGWSTALPLQVWARALDTVSTASGPSASSAATKILGRLHDRKLIERARKGRERKVRVTLLSADGSGQPYTRPVGAGHRDRFIRLDHAFWSEGWAQELSLPAIAMLLIALHEKPGFTLPSEKVPEWYGWSADTAERGMRELEGHELVRIDKESFTAPLSPSGISVRNRYTVLPPFDTASVNRHAASQRRRRP